MKSCLKKSLILLSVFMSQQAFSDERKNFFNDPFVQATYGIKQCAIPEGPSYSLDEIRSQSHYRVERGTSCFQSGRCRLPNSYLYDKDLIDRVKRFIQMNELYADTSIWLIGQRRWVTLRGCVRSLNLADELISAIRTIDEVEEVINELSIVQ